MDSSQRRIEPARLLELFQGRHAIEHVRIGIGNRACPRAETSSSAGSKGIALASSAAARATASGWPSRWPSEQHAGQSRTDRQPGHRPPQRRDVARRIDGAQSPQAAYRPVRKRRRAAARTRETSHSRSRPRRAVPASVRPDRGGESPAPRSPAGRDASARPRAAGKRPAACVRRGPPADRPRPARSAPVAGGPCRRADRRTAIGPGPYRPPPVMPSMVSDVSATFVDSTTLRRPIGPSTSSCFSAGRSP